MSPVATLFFQWGRCYSGFVTPLYGALLSPTPPSAYLVRDRLSGETGLSLLYSGPRYSIDESTLSGSRHPWDGRKSGERMPQMQGLHNAQITATVPSLS